MSAKDIASSLMRPLAGAVLLVALAAPAAIAVAGLSGVGHRWIDILAQFTGPALVAAVIGLLVAAVLRYRALIAVAGLVLGLVVLAGWPQWAPARGKAADGSPTLTVYSANLHAGNDDIDAITASIAASDADIVMLVEFGYGPSRAIDRILAGYPHRVSNGWLERPNGIVNSVIASRRPLVQTERSLPYLSFVGAVAETSLGPITLGAAHFTRPWPYQIQWEQIRQAEGLSAWARSVDGPVIAAGDFNSVSSARIGRMIRKDAGLIPAPGWPGTWPMDLPAFAAVTIDQVYRSPDLALMDRRLGLPTGSDHRPVITRFARAEVSAARPAP